MVEQNKTLVASLAAPVMLFFAIGVMGFVFSRMNVNLQPMLAVIIAMTPIWLPFALFHILFEQWQYAARSKWIYDNGRVTLRIKLPQEVLKSPEAMESVMTQIHNPSSADNLMQTYFDGRHPLNNSFELASVNGEVRFYINVPRKKVKNAVEAQLYAQYPGIEVIEEKIDYAAEIKWDPKKLDMISFHFVKKDDDALPIKTYIDYGLDKIPDEENKFEPMSPMLEHIGKAKPTERIWIQFICKPHVKKSLKTGDLYTVDSWEKRVQKKVDELMGRDNNGLGPEETDNRPMLTMSERDTIAAVERNVSKYAYEVAVRAMYIAENGKFDPEMISPILRSFAQYDMIGRNRIGITWRTDFNYNFFQDFSGRRKLYWKKKELEAYKARSYLPGDVKTFADKMKVMSVEELATMYHIPGTSVITPAISRVDSVRKEAPSNLPTGLF
ncbi:hypothetical protein H6784_00775 [Candidatus Nomurabacteria bacterium]|nr:hypothetical protein [Candidatus Kaiserbacteria bacterium]MCB9813925.1 hypothetical protein [Candidatus Nomurabacteria bacterium]